MPNKNELEKLKKKKLSLELDIRILNSKIKKYDEEVFTPALNQKIESQRKYDQILDELETTSIQQNTILLQQAENAKNLLNENHKKYDSCYISLSDYKKMLVLAKDNLKKINEEISKFTNINSSEINAMGRPQPSTSRYYPSPSAPPL